MLVQFLLHIKHSGLKVSTTEWLDLVGALQACPEVNSVDAFYLLARTCLIKDESLYDKFDQAFGRFFEGVRALPDPFDFDLPEDWLNNPTLNHFSEEEKAAIEAMGGIEKLMEILNERLKEQKERHQGGSKWIGTGGTSPFGHSGYNPEGVRIGGPGKHNKAVKVWEQRHYKNLDSHVELGTRNIKIALRALRNFARTGSSEELDLEDTISSTAKNAGLLEVKMRPERHNAVKVLLLLDVGGSMDYHVKESEELFSACQSEFKHLKHFYFHNFVYDHLWQDNKMHRHNLTPLHDIIHTYGKDYKLIIVGDASMSPYEIVSPFGSIDFMNESPGAYYFKQLFDHFEKAIWLNPTPESQWDYVQSIGIVNQLMEEKMYPLTVDGITQGIKALT